MNGRFDNSCYDGGRKPSYVAMLGEGIGIIPSSNLYNFGINKTTALVY